MMKLSKRIEELLEEYNFNICREISERYGEKGKYDIELETYSPEGETLYVRKDKRWILDSNKIMILNGG